VLFDEKIGHAAALASYGPAYQDHHRLRKHDARQR
jgi:hypothetical protein